MNKFKIRAATRTYFTDIDIEAGTIEQAITQFSAIVDEDPSNVFCDQEFDDGYDSFTPTHIDNISDGDTHEELMDYGDKDMPERWRHPDMVAKLERQELVDALKEMYAQFSANADYSDDDKAVITQAHKILAKVGGKT